MANQIDAGPESEISSDIQSKRFTVDLKTSESVDQYDAEFKNGANRGGELFNGRAEHLGGKVADIHYKMHPRTKNGHWSITLIDGATVVGSKPSVIIRVNNQRIATNAPAAIQAGRQTVSINCTLNDSREDLTGYKVALWHAADATLELENETSLINGEVISHDLKTNAIIVACDSLLTNNQAGRWGLKLKKPDNSRSVYSDAHALTVNPQPKAKAKLKPGHPKP